MCDRLNISTIILSCLHWCTIIVAIHSTVDCLCSLLSKLCVPCTPKKFHQADAAASNVVVNMLPSSKAMTRSRSMKS